MKEGALDRVARSLNLIPFISNNPGLSVVELAERFNSTPSQISKDLTLLNMCGLPGYGYLELIEIEYEDPEFISIRDAQVLSQPRSLTQLEALTLLLGLQLLGELASEESERLAIGLLQKRLADLLGEQLTSAFTIADGVKELPLVSEISRAIEAQQLLTIDYNSASSDSLTQREIFPLALSFHDGIAYLQAISVAEGDRRIFRVDRIIHSTYGEIKVGFADTFSFTPEQALPQEIEIELGSEGLFFVEKHNEIVTSCLDLGDNYLITLQLTPGEWIVRTLLAWPSPVRVLKPAQLSVTLHERIKSTLANYQ